jgi:hypothetical protein
MTKISTLITTNYPTQTSKNNKSIIRLNSKEVKSSTLEFLVNYSKNLRIEPSIYLGKFEFITS